MGAKRFFNVRLWIVVPLLMPLLIGLQVRADASENAGGADSVSAEGGDLFLILPWTTHKPGLRSDVILTNREQRPVSITITGHDHTGFPLIVHDVLNVLEAKEIRVIDTRLLPPETASLRVDADGAIDGSVNFGTSDGRKSDTITSFRSAADQLDLPVPSGNPSHRSLILFNPNDEYAEVTVQARDKEGYEVTSAVFELAPMAPQETRTVALPGIVGAAPQSEVATVRFTSVVGLMGIQIVDEPFGKLENVAALSITGANLRLTLDYNECGTYNYGDTWLNVGRHTGQDYACGRHLSPVKVASYGKVVYTHAMPRQYDGKCTTSKPDHGMGTVIEIEHLLTTGEKIFSSYNHLESTTNTTDNSVSRFNATARPRVAKGEVVGRVGASGQQNNNYWNFCYGYTTNQHLHFEIKRNWYGICGTGAMYANGGNKSCSTWGYVSNHPDSYDYRHPDNYLGNSTILRSCLEKVIHGIISRNLCLTFQI